MINLNIVDREQQLRKRRSKSFKTTLIRLTKLVYIDLKLGYSQWRGDLHAPYAHD